MTDNTDRRSVEFYADNPWIKRILQGLEQSITVSLPVSELPHNLPYAMGGQAHDVSLRVNYTGRTLLELEFILNDSGMFPLSTDDKKRVLRDAGNQLYSKQAQYLADDALTMLQTAQQNAESSRTRASAAGVGLAGYSYYLSTQNHLSNTDMGVGVAAALTAAFCMLAAKRKRNSLENILTAKAYRQHVAAGIDQKLDALRI